jgi:Xaa-Pro aminopeptidase
VNLPRAQHAVAQEGLGGWLFYNLQHRDRVSDRILGIPDSVHNTRPWVYLVRPEGSARKLVHVIEERILDSLPGERLTYASRGEFLEGLRELSRGLGPVACQYSSELPMLSYLDHGTVQLLEECGFRLRSSQALIQRFLGVLDEEAARSHERAAVHLYAIVTSVWNRLRGELGAGRPLGEGEVQAWILEEFRARGLETETAPAVAVGRHSADPHYEPSGGGALLEPGRVLLLDLWAREPYPESVYADITWVGVLAGKAGDEVQRAFAAVARARDEALHFIREALGRGEEPAGADVDRRARAVLQEAGYGKYLKHRTGHAIDAQLHGYGANLDSLEFPDPRRLIEGSCFSVEPGVYLPDFGVRSEVDVLIREGAVVVTGGEPQTELLKL